MGVSLRTGGTAILVLFSWASGCFHVDGCCSRPSGDSGTRPVCGNGAVEPGEQCEPPGSGDCDGSCLWFRPGVCGNGVIDQPDEQCDDGNLVAGDGCSPICQLESGPACGNGIIEAGEQCEPPDGVTCDESCQLISCLAPPSDVGGPCNNDCDCVSYEGVPGRCLDEATHDIPGGYCTLAFCAPASSGGEDSCPEGSSCRRFRASGMADEFRCLQECTPSPSGSPGCRSDVNGGYAHTCVPVTRNPSRGFCFRGCEDDLGCRRCTELGTCERNPAVACASETDCPATYTCQTTVSFCVPAHPPGPADIGDPCSAHSDCPQYALCHGGGGGAPVFWPGGYCTIRYCASFDGLPEFACPTGSICPALYGFRGGRINVCAATCTVDGGSGECNVNRGDAFDYECLEASQVGGDMLEYFDSIGAPGFCYQCEAEFSMNAASCP